MNFQDLSNNAKAKIHFIGVGGIGMSALALLLKDAGVAVQGSDISTSYITEKLIDHDVAVFFGHDAKNISSDISLIVKTSIIKDDNPEIVAAKKLGIEIITRANLLAQMMQKKEAITIAGTHGKTSTTAITAAAVEESGLDPIVVNGGIINSYQSNFKVGKGKYFIAESDESDGSFVDLPTTIGAVTNIEPEHLDFYNNSFDKQKEYFKKYISQIPDHGLCALCVDSPEVDLMYQSYFFNNSNIVTYSIKEDKKANIKAQNIELTAFGSKFDVDINGNDIIREVFLPAYGPHNVSNSLATIAICRHLGIDDQVIKKGLKSYKGVKRRFSKVGEYNSCAIIDDYAHHPTEIAALISSAKQFAGKGKVILVLQPHKYSRVRDLFDEFCQSVKGADHVIVCDIYSANQEPIAGVSKEALCDKIKDLIADKLLYIDSDNDIAKALKSVISAGDIVLCAGAGTITNIAHKLEEQLKSL